MPPEVHAGSHTSLAISCRLGRYHEELKLLLIAPAAPGGRGLELTYEESKPRLAHSRQYAKICLECAYEELELIMSEKPTLESARLKPAYEASKPLLPFASLSPQEGASTKPSLCGHASQAPHSTFTGENNNYAL